MMKRLYCINILLFIVFYCNNVHGIVDGCCNVVLGRIPLGLFLRWLFWEIGERTLTTRESFLFQDEWGTATDGTSGVSSFAWGQQKQ